MNSTAKYALNLGLIVLASLVIVVGLLICSTVKGDQQFIIGVVIIGIGFIFVSLIKDFFKGRTEA